MTFPELGWSAGHHFQKYAIEITKASEAAGVANVAYCDTWVGEEANGLLETVTVQKFVEFYVGLLCEQTAEVHVADIHGFCHIVKGNAFIKVGACIDNDPLKGFAGGA